MKITSVPALQAEIHQVAKEHGWWDKTRGIPELLCLVHSEVSEALTAFREGDPVGMAEELADVVIRVFDMAEQLGIDLEEEIMSKHEYNKTRPYRHGGKLA
jgi:NTP pyrophosphatase (non-canonical NTP hydrolase)